MLMGWLLYLGGAFCLSIGVVVAFGLMLEIENRWRRFASPLIFGVMVFAMAAGTLLSGRNVSLAGQDLSELAGAGSSGGTWLLRVCTLVVTGIAGAKIVATWLRRETSAAAGVWLFVGFCCFFLTNSVANALLGAHPTFIHGIYYAFLVFAAAYLGRVHGLQEVLVVTRNGMFLFLFLSCFVALFKPSIAIQNAYAGVVPGVTVRFWGLGSNPNSIGPLSAVFLMSTIMLPYRTRIMTMLAISLALLVLLLSQSKTAWVAVCIALAIIYAIRLQQRDRPEAQKFARGVALLIGLVLVLTVTTVAFLTADVGSKVGRFLATEQGAQVTTLTGRAAIWEIALAAWSENPIFGYGVSMWDAWHRFSVGMPFAFSAHNQWLQSLGSAGALGLLGLLVYMAMLIVYAWRARMVTQGVSIGLVVFLLLRCVTETPLETDTLFNADTFTHLFVFVVLIVSAGRVVDARDRAVA